MLVMFSTLLLLMLAVAVMTVDAQFGYCAGRYAVCDYRRPCCGGGLDPLVCIPSVAYSSLCYPYSEYLAHINSQKTTKPPKVCAGLYQNCDFVSCCEDLLYPKVCAGTAQGKFCFLKPAAGTVSTTPATNQTTSAQAIASVTPPTAATATSPPTVTETPATTSTSPPVTSARDIASSAAAT